MPNQNNHESIKTHIQYIREDIKEIKENMVTRNEFEPIKRGFYGILAAIASVIIAGLAMLFGFGTKS